MSARSWELHLPESCSDASDDCPADGPNLTTECRAAVAECDAAESCSDASDDCPADAKAECAVVTDSSLCPFDVDANACGAGDQFRLVFTPDVQKWPAFKLSSGNPGRTFYNAVLNGDPGETVPLEIHVPYPYVTVGAQALHVYDALDLGFADGPNGACFVPEAAIASESVRIVIQDYRPKCISGVCSNGAGSCATDAECGQDLPYDLTCVTPPGACDGAKAGTPTDLDGGYCTFTVDVPIPASGQAYVNLHLDYGLEGPHTDACSDGAADRYDAKPVAGGYDALENLDESTATAYDDDLAGDVAIPQCQQYLFGHACGAPATCVDMDTVASVNEFKRIAGVVGQAMAAEETAAAGVTLRLLKGTTVVASSTTDADGFYALGYRHTGKAANFTVKVVGSDLAQVVTLKANGYVQVNWDLATGAASTEYGSGWTPK